MESEHRALILKRMLDVHSLRVEPVPPDSEWLTAIRLSFTQDGVKKNWDLIEKHDSIQIVVFNVTKNKLVFVKQFRPACYYCHIPRGQNIDTEKYPPKLGITLELCAGIVDKDLSLIEIAKEELKEECGYEAPISAFEHIITYRNVTASSKESLFYVEVTDEMHKYPGGGAESEGELIEIVEMTVQEVKDYLSSKEFISNCAFLFGVNWFLNNKLVKNKANG